jgi:hypothetical protein
MLQRIKQLIEESDYKLFIRPFELNIVGLRSKSVKSNSFDDEIHVFYTLPSGKWNYHIYPATTDPGTYWLNNPAYTQGTAILHQGQYSDAYALGKHRGKYEALVQVKPVTVIRDYDRDAILDFNNGTKQEGLFGINIHRASANGNTLSIDKYSAGCQVFQDAEDYMEFMTLCKNHAMRYGNSFTYTLIDFRAIRRVTLKRILSAVTFFALASLGFIINKTKRK